VKTAWCTSGEDLDRNKGEHGRFDSTDRITNRLYRFLHWKIGHQLDPFTSMHHFIICVVSLLSVIDSLLRFKKQEEPSPK
jgi:hypothetical protein